MKERTKGAWVLHHSNKLRQFETSDFDEIDFAGKAGHLLSGLAASHEESRLQEDQVKAIAKGAGIRPTELPTILGKLEEASLIERSKSGEVATIGIVTSNVLQHTSSLFDALNPSQFQIASIHLADKVSSEPMDEKILSEYISDTLRMSTTESADVLRVSEDAGLIDAEIIDKSKVFFNGNLFKSDTLQKTNAVLASLSQSDQRSLTSLSNEIARTGVVTIESALTIVSSTLFEKVQSIGMFETSSVSNEKETRYFVTKPEAFAKFGNPFEDDVLDLAKALVASLSYGMLFSDAMRGRIDFLPQLLRALIAGRTIGPAPAIGRDYKYLEVKRVVKIIPAGGGYYKMKLLKREVGEMALQIMQKGDAAESTVLQGKSDAVNYSGPEANRMLTRRKRQLKKSDVEAANLLRTLRK